MPQPNAPCAPAFVSSPLNYIFNKSLSSGNLPSHIKYTIIKLFFKKGDMNNTWCVQVLRSPKEAFAAAMQLWRERCEKCVCLQGDYVEK